MDGADRHFERSLGQRIRELRGSRSREAFAAELNIHKNTLARYETGQRMPDAALIRRLCDHCGVAAESLLGAAGSPEQDTAEDYIRPPLLREEDGGVSPVSVHRGWVDAQRLPAERLRLYVVEDDAMAPVVAAGEMLLVKLQRPAPWMQGLYVLEMDGAYTVRRLQTTDAGQIAVQAESLDRTESRHPISAFHPGGAYPLVGAVVWQVRAPE